MKNYLFEIIDENSDLCGECFFVQAKTTWEAWVEAEKYFPNETLECLGKYSDFECELMGYDVY